VAAPPARPADKGSPPADRAPGRIDGNAPAPTQQPQKLNSFWDQPALIKTWELGHLSTKDEFQLGRELHDLILQFNGPLETGSWQQRVEEAAKPFLKTLSRREIAYTFTILDSNAVNAFSHPGGFIYVSRGLFNLIGEDEEYALEFVIGHEIAHVELQHALKCLRDPGVMKLREGTLQKLYMMIIPFGYYPDALEYEADRWAYQRMTQHGRSEHESLAFLRKFDKYADNNGFKNGRGKPQPGSDSTPLENHFRAHTAAWRRLDRLKELMGKP
jgi:hypothetical protein